MAEQKQSNEELLSRFSSSAEKWFALTSSLSQDDLDLSTEIDGWTIRQHIHHIAEDCDVWSMCIKKAIATPGVFVRFEGFPGNEAWAAALDYQNRKTKSAQDLIGAHRRYLAQLLAHFIDDWEGFVKITNAEGQTVAEMTVSAMVKMLTEHLLEHVEIIAKTKESN
jgi:hypothetical protein